MLGYKVLLAALVVTLMLLDFSAALTCPIYRCASLNPEKQEAPRICAKAYTNDTSAFEDLDECPSSSYVCQGLLGLKVNQVASCEYITTIIKKKNLPGYVCLSNEECLSGSCVNHMCVGVSKNESCEQDVDCDVGLFCNSKDQKCQKLSHDGQFCSSDQKCHFWGTCVEGRCTRVLSKPAGDKVTNDTSETSAYAACDTLFVIKKSDGLYCADGPSLDGDVKRMSNETCRYYLNRDDKGNNTAPYMIASPKCGYSENNSTYCPKGFGDLRDELDALKAFINEKPLCHINDQWLGCDSAIGIKGRNNAIAASILLNGRNGISQSSYLYEDNSDCTKRMITNDYWNAKDEMTSKKSDASSIKTILAMVMTIVALFVLL